MHNFDQKDQNFAIKLDLGNHGNINFAPNYGLARLALSPPSEFPLPSVQGFVSTHPYHFSRIRLPVESFMYQEGENDED
jgi:hypothetical protein